MLASGARVVAADTTFDAIEGLLRRLDNSWFQAGAIAARIPCQVEGPKTIAYETTVQSATLNALEIAMARQLSKATFRPVRYLCVFPLDTGRGI